MRRIAIGLAVGVAVFVGSAVAAEAQVIQIDPIGPTSVTPSMSSVTYKANLTPGLYLPFDVQLKVYKNSETTPRFTSGNTLYTVTGTVLHSKRITISGWGLQAGDVLKFHLECWWDPSGQLTSNDYSVTVTGS